MRRLSLTFVIAVAIAAALPVAAHGATYKLDAGNDDAAGAPKPTAPLKFYTPLVKVHPGDEVAWKIKGFHNVAFLKRGQKVPAFLTSATINIEGLNDASGVPFWFNGKPYTDQTPQAKVTSPPGQPYSGDKYLNSGNPALPTSPKTFSVKFTKKGKFNYYCLAHPGMTARVDVVSKSKKIASPAKVSRLVKRQERKDAKIATRVLKTKNAKNSVGIGRQSNNGVSVNRFFPANLTVKAGTSVRFTSDGNPVDELHTVTFGPEAHAAQAYGGSAPVPGHPGVFLLSPHVGPYASEPSLKDLSYDGTNHGDGFLNLGLLNRDVADIKIKFPKAGTYSYICVFHKGMDGKITVQ